MRSAYLRLAKPEHRCAERMLGFALTLSTEASWLEFASIAYARLSNRERVALAWASLQSLEPEQAAAVCGIVVGGAGFPQAAFLSQMDQASFWSDMASDHELDAYCLACFNRMQPTRQVEFLAHVQRRAA